jgi:hypothetical protein
MNNPYDRLQSIVVILNSEGRRDEARALTRKVYAAPTRTRMNRVLDTFTRSGQGDSEPATWVDEDALGRFMHTPIDSDAIPPLPPRVR